MVCDDCKSQLSVVSAPDPWKAGSASSSAHRKIDENKALRKGVRANPYGNCCKICKMKVQQNNATYCTMCAYAKGICAICGKQVLDTSMYKMSEGGNFMHTVGKREESSFKSQEQIAREAAQNDLFTYLQSTGQVGRMPTREALEVAGRGDLAKALIASFGGLHAAADSMGLSKRLLNEEAEAKKSQKRHAAQKEAAEAEERRRRRRRRERRRRRKQRRRGRGGWQRVKRRKTTRTMICRRESRCHCRRRRRRQRKQRRQQQRRRRRRRPHPRRRRAAPTIAGSTTRMLGYTFSSPPSATLTVLGRCTTRMESGAERSREIFNTAKRRGDCDTGDLPGKVPDTHPSHPQHGHDEAQDDIKRHQIRREHGGANPEPRGLPGVRDGRRGARGRSAEQGREQEARHQPTELFEEQSVPDGSWAEPFNSKAEKLPKGANRTRL